MKKLILTVFASAAIVSCSTMASGTAKVGTAQPSIDNTTWSLAENVKGNRPTLVVESGKISGNGGCNRYFGNLNVDTASGSFTTSNIGSTKMACDNMGTEQTYFSALGQANKYVVSNNVLELYKDKLLLLKFNRTK